MASADSQQGSGSLVKSVETGIPNVALATNSRINNRVEDISLNVDRTLLKQLQATKRDTLVEYTTTGGGITGVADAASYELIKNAILHYYENYPGDQGEACINRDVDKKGRVLALVIRVMNVDSLHVYTLNAYHTRCSFLVNGKQVDKFMNDDLPKIHDLIRTVVLNGKGVNLKSLNQALEFQLKRLLGIEQNDKMSILVNQKTVKNTTDITCIEM